MRIVRNKTFSVGAEAIAFLNFSIQDARTPLALHHALSECDSAVGLRNVVRQTFFLADRVDRRLVARGLKGAYGAAMPATTYVSQPPAEEHALSAELWACATPGAVTQRAGVSVMTLAGGTWCFVGGIETSEKEAAYEGARRTLRRAERKFRRARSAFEKAVRTWYYVGNILGTEGNDSRYDLVNRARNEFYRDKWPDLRLSPASTGIGMNTNRVALEGFALRAEPQAARVIWVDNPLQTPPCLYDIKAGRNSQPAFSRAAAVRLGETTLLFLSGTASIRGSHVVYPGEPKAQTETTIENMATLIGEENLTQRYGFDRGATLLDLQQFRVYVKRPTDLDSIRACCRQHLPDVPHSYLVAGICRPECLVEIEGVAAFRSRNS